MNRSELDDTLQVIASVLLNCFFLCAALILYWFVFYLLAGDWAHAFHSRWFEISRYDFGLMNYYGMAFLKIGAFMLFLIPYFSIKLVLWRNKKLSV